jgi:hypothetical protein
MDGCPRRSRSVVCRIRRPVLGSQEHCYLFWNHQLEAESGRRGERHDGWPRAWQIREAESRDYRVLLLLIVVELIIKDLGVDQWHATTRIVGLAGSPLECEFVLRIRATVQHCYDEFVSRAVIVAGTEIVGARKARHCKYTAQGRERAGYE